jgi:hypothetical protein
MHFCTRDPNPNPTRTELGLGAGYFFHPWVHPKQKKNETRKKPETQKNSKPENPPKETHLQNPMGTRTRLET